MVLYFDDSLVEVENRTKNFIVIDTKFRDACVGGLCEGLLDCWRSGIGSEPQVKEIIVGTRKFQWDAPYWNLY